MGHSVQDAIEWLQSTKPALVIRELDKFLDTAGCDDMRELINESRLSNSDFEIADKVRDLRMKFHIHLAEVVSIALRDARYNQGPLTAFYAAAKGDGK